MTTPKPASAPPVDALLPCPFCGNPNVTDDEGCFPLNHEHSRWEVRCGNPSCYAHEQQGATREEATAKWNRRAASAQVRAVEPSILSAGTLALLEKSRRTSDKINALLARDALGLIQSLIAWNRAQEYPPIRIGYEAGVAEFFSPSVAAKPAAEPVPMLRIEDFYSRQGPRKVYRIPPFEEAEPVPMAQGDAMLPDTLGPVAREWYVLCERAPHATKIGISGELAEAIVATIADHARRDEAWQERYLKLETMYVQQGLNFAAHMKRSDETEASLAACRAELQEMADHGLRFDLNPTHDVSAAEEFWHDYFRRADRSIRERAAATLRQEAPHAE